jgi:ribosomal protein L39E
MSKEKATGEARKQRLAKALKANLARRKAQAHAQSKTRESARPAGKSEKQD